MPNHRDPFRLRVAGTPRWPRHLTPHRCSLDSPSSLSSPQDAQSPFQRRRPLQWVSTLLPQRASFLSSPRPPPLPSVPRDRGMERGERRTRRSPGVGPSQAVIPDWRARGGLKGGPGCLGLVGSVLQAERLSCLESRGGMRAPCRLRRLDPAALKTHTWAPPNFGFGSSGHSINLTKAPRQLIVAVGPEARFYRH